MSSYDEHLISMAGGDGNLTHFAGDDCDALTAADNAYTAAVQAAVAGRGDWASVQVAGRAVRQARATKKVEA